MKIDRIEIISLEVPYRRPVAISAGTIQAAKNVLIKIHVDEGLVGLGEVSPFIPAYSGETQETAVGILDRWIAPNIMGEDPFDIERVHKLMDELVPGNGCAKAGIDIALYDLMGKALEVPIYKLIGGALRDKIPLLYAVSWDQGVQAMAEEAAARIEQGFRGIMVKVGRGVEADIESIKLVREKIGDTVPLIADPNQAYSRYEAISLAKGIGETAQALEGPVRKWDLQGLRAIRQLGLIELIADESLSTPADARRIVRQEAADMLLIKPLRVGGFHPARKIASIAESAGVRCYAASMTNLGVGHAANLHFAASAQLDDRFGHGFENLFQIFGDEQSSEEGNICDVPPFENGSYSPPRGSGLGVELIPENVERYATGRWVCG